MSLEVVIKENFISGTDLVEFLILVSGGCPPYLYEFCINNRILSISNKLCVPYYEVPEKAIAKVTDSCGNTKSVWPIILTIFKDGIPAILSRCWIRANPFTTLYAHPSSCRFDQTLTRYTIFLNTYQVINIEEAFINFYYDLPTGMTFVYSVTAIVSDEISFTLIEGSRFGSGNIGIRGNRGNPTTDYIREIRFDFRLDFESGTDFPNRNVVTITGAQITL